MAGYAMRQTIVATRSRGEKVTTQAGGICPACSQCLAGRRGKQRAIMAVAHAILGWVFHRLCRHAGYRALGPPRATDDSGSAWAIDAPGGWDLWALGCLLHW